MGASRRGEPTSHPTAQVVYPESDGEPMGENCVQVKRILALYLGFVRHFRGRHDVFVAADTRLAASLRELGLDPDAV